MSGNSKEKPLNLSNIIDALNHNQDRLQVFFKKYRNIMVAGNINTDPSTKMTRELAIEAWQVCRSLIYNDKQFSITDPQQLTVGRMLFRKEALESTITSEPQSFCFGGIANIEQSPESQSLNHYHIKFFPRSERVESIETIAAVDNQQFGNDFNLSDTLNNFVPLENYYLFYLSFKTLVPGVEKFLPQVPKNDRRVRTLCETVEEEFNKEMGPELRRETTIQILLSDPVIGPIVQEILAEKLGRHQLAALDFMGTTWNPKADQYEAAIRIAMTKLGIKRE